MLAINEMTADAMLGTPDSDLWHNVDDLLHNVNDLMSRLDQRQGDEGSQGEEQEEADGVFFTREAAPSGRSEEASAAVDDAAADYSTPYTEVQVRSQPFCLVTTSMRAQWHSTNVAGMSYTMF